MKKNFKRIAAFALALMLLVALGAAAYADGGSDSAASIYDGSRFVSGQNVSDSDTVEGILAAAGYDVYLAGKSQYTMGAGYNVSAAGDTANDAFLAGYNVTVYGSAARDLFAAGNVVTLDGSVGRNAYLAGNSVLVSGEVGGDLYIDAENVSIADSAVISGKLHIAESAGVAASDKVRAEVEWFESANSAAAAAASEAAKPATTASKITSWVISLVGVIVVALVLLWLTPLWETVDARYYGAPFAEYARAFGIGFAVLAGLPVAAVLLLITRVGVRLALVLVFVYAAAIAVAPVFIGFAVGMLLWRGALKKAPCYLAELPIGVLAWRIAASIPGVSFVVGLVCVPLGLGMLTLLLGKKPRCIAPGKAPVAAEALPEAPTAE